MSDVTLGAPLRLTFTTRVGAILTDASTVTLNIRKPDGTNEAPIILGAVIRDSIGTYHYDYTAPTAGHYDAYWVSTGPASAALNYVFDVASAYATGLATLAQAKAYLNMSTTITVNDDELRQFLDSATGYISEITGYTGQPKTVVWFPFRSHNLASHRPGANITLPDGGVASIISIIDSNNNTIDPSRYVLSPGSGIITWVWYPPSFSALPSYSLTITYLLPPVPDRIREAVCDLTADLWRSQRGATAGSRWHTAAALSIDELGGPMPRWKTLIAQDTQDTLAFG